MLENQTICIPGAEVHDVLPLVRQPPVQRIARKGAEILHCTQAAGILPTTTLCHLWTVDCNKQSDEAAL